MSVPSGEVNRIVNEHNGHRHAGYQTITINIEGFNPGELLSTDDFPLTDPWSKGMLASLKEEQPYMQELLQPDTTPDEDLETILGEIGSGDFRNPIWAARLGVIPTGLIFGVDIVKEKVEMARANIARDPILSRHPTEVIHADAIEYLDFLKEKGARLFGQIIMCVPQVPSFKAADGSFADVYDTTNPQLRSFGEQYVDDSFTIDDFGLTLNAAILAKLRDVVQPGTRVIAALSHRVPRAAREFIFNSVGNGETGNTWKLLRRYKTGLIQHDPDTSLVYVTKFDDGYRLFGLNEDGNYVPISAVEAERRRRAAIRQAQFELGITSPYEQCDKEEKDGIVTVARAMLNVAHSVGYYVAEAA